MQKPDVDDYIIVEDFLANFLGVPKKKIRIDSDIRFDLGVDGDDADHLIEAFSREFDVDISKFHIEEYFGSEKGINPIAVLLQLIFARKYRPRGKRLMVRDLVHALGAKRLC